tara:strand:+ start:18 stop:578 length:561 start_codon:yes stop_codon:yes gene_type:complete
MNNDFLSEILNNTRSRRDSEYKKVDFKIPEFNENKSQNISDMEIKNLKYKLDKITNQKKGSDKFKEHETDLTHVDIINCNNVFNIVKDQSEYVEWKKLVVELKLEKLKVYLDKNMEELFITEDQVEELMRLVKDNKINYKKYINYDKINAQIISLPILALDSENEKCEINLDNKKTKKIKSIYFNK